MNDFLSITPAEIRHEEYGILQIHIVQTYKAESVEEFAEKKREGDYYLENYLSEDYGYLDENDIRRVISTGEADPYRIEENEEIPLPADELQLFYEILENGREV